MTRYVVAAVALLTSLGAQGARAAQPGAPVALSCVAGAEEQCSRMLAELQAAGLQVHKVSAPVDVGAEFAAARAVVEVKRDSQEVVVLLRRDGVLERRAYRPDEGEAPSEQIVAIQVAEWLRAVFGERVATEDARRAQAAPEPAVAMATAPVLAPEPAPAPSPVAVATTRESPGAGSNAPWFHDAATVGKGRLVLSSATRYGGGFAGYTGADGPFVGQTLGVALGATDWLQVGVGGGLAYGGSGCVEGSVSRPPGTMDPPQCFARVHYSGELRLGVRLYRSSSDGLQLGIEVSGSVSYVPYPNVEYAELGGAAALLASAKLWDGRLLPYARVGWDYKAAPEDLYYSDNSPFAVLGAELPGTKARPFLEAGVAAPRGVAHRQRVVTFSVSLGVTGTAL